MQRKFQATDTHKRCPACEAWLPHADFATDRRHPTGLFHYCRKCWGRMKRGARRTVLGWARQVRNDCKMRARAKSLPFDLTADFLIGLRERTPDCTCCLRPMTFIASKQTYLDGLSASVDRIRPEKGYAQSNVALICIRCNVLKGDGDGFDHGRIQRYIVREKAKRSSNVWARKLLSLPA